MIEIFDNILATVMMIVIIFAIVFLIYGPPIVDSFIFYKELFINIIRKLKK